VNAARFEPWMRRALAVAASSVGSADVPVGCVIFDPDGRELAAAGNRREATGDPTAHAEILALRAAAATLGSWRLTGCTLVVTLEPCTMCAGALVLARIGTVVFGAWEPKTGAVGSLWDVVRDRRLNHRPEVYSGVLADEAGELLRDFFDTQR
jgi:tRNA(adenine34) deaminase